MIMLGIIIIATEMGQIWRARGPDAFVFSPVLWAGLPAKPRRASLSISRYTKTHYFASKMTNF
jgi:hypothetical protein